MTAFIQFLLHARRYMKYARFTASVVQHFDTQEERAAWIDYALSEMSPNGKWSTVSWTQIGSKAGVLGK